VILLIGVASLSLSSMPLLMNRCVSVSVYSENSRLISRRMAFNARVVIVPMVRRANRAESIGMLLKAMAIPPNVTRTTIPIRMGSRMIGVADCFVCKMIFCIVFSLLTFLYFSV